MSFVFGSVLLINAPDAPFLQVSIVAIVGGHRASCWASSWCS